ncbi:MAG: diacylglycerol kinase family lipid kinase [Micrococcales bacterium]|nr:diacylglycerol kinase family lipid kinase [Micrococcales bacterium]
MKQVLGLVVNPTAGKGKAHKADPQLREAFTKLGFQVEDLTAPDLAAATSSTRHAVVEGLDALVVAGGDGMTHLGVNAVAGTSLPLGLIGLGTGNDVVRGLGLPRNKLDEGVKAIAAALETGPRRIDAVKISDTTHSMQEWFCGVLSAGFDAAVNALANQLQFPRGESVYVRALMKELRHYRPYGFEVEVDGQPVWQGPAALVAVANGYYIGGGMKIAPQAVMDDGFLDVVIGGPLSRAALLRVFPKVYRGNHMHHRQVHAYKGKTVTIKPRLDLGPQPPDAHTDGERIGPLPLRCEVVPGAVLVLAPPQ